MSLPRLAVSRPVATIMFYLGLCLLGVISWFKLPQDLFPPITYPQVTVVTTYANAAPAEVETLITKPIEESISTVADMKQVKSISREGLSIITAEFSWNTRMDFAALAIRQKIDLIKERLPREADEPIVKKLNPFDMPVLVLSVRGNLPEDRLLQYGRKTVKEMLAKVEGVASVTVSGGREQEITVEVDAGMMRARNIDITKIGRTLQEANLNYPAGTAKETFYEYLIRTQGEFESIDEIGATVLQVEYSDDQASGRDLREEASTVGMVKVEDIAEVHEGYAETTNLSRYNGSDNILISVYKQSDANVIKTAERLKKALYQLEQLRVAPVYMDVVYDKSRFIKEAIDGVKSAGLQGGVLAFIVLFLFLQSARSALVVAATIPISILIVFILMFFKGLTVNMMSLGGLALGVGMLVDNSIVVMENIMRKGGKGSKDAGDTAVEGTNQVGGAIFASTLTTIAVFLPMVFLTGIEGQLFKELAFTVTFALGASLLVALTLIPRLSFGWLHTVRPAPWLKQFGVWIGLAEDYYGVWLQRVLARKVRFLGFVFLLFIVALLILRGLPRQMMPAVDEGQFGVTLTMRPGTPLDRTDEQVKIVEEVLLKHPDVWNVSVTIGSKPSEATEGSPTLGSHQAQMTVVLRPARNIHTADLVQQLYGDLQARVDSHTSLEFEMITSGIGSAIDVRAPITLRVHSKDLDTLQEKSRHILQLLNEVPGLINLHTTLAEPAPETRIRINKERAALAQLSAQDISLAAQTAIKGSEATTFKDEKGEEIPIKVRLREENREDLDQIENIPVWAGPDHSVFLGDLVTFEQGLGPSEIQRLNQKKIEIITADVSGRSLDQVKSEIRTLLEPFADQENLEVTLVEETREEKESFHEMVLTLLFSILLVYMIMAAQFESFYQPFLIMVTVPTALIGVALSLVLTGTAVSAVTLLGVIMLGGIVVNNGIVLVEYIHQMSGTHKSIEKAVVAACKIRFRPIIMTTLTTLLGLAPLALGMGEGAELRAPMAIAVIGGLTLSTVLTLLVLPSLYLLTSPLAAKFSAGARD